MSFGGIVIILILLWIFIYTCSYGIWTWKKKNKLGACMVFFLALVSLLLPIYTVFFREG